LALAVGEGDAQQKNVLKAQKAAAPPALDGTLDATWQKAQPLTVKAVGGRNLPGGSTDVSIRAVYSGDMIYWTCPSFVDTWVNVSMRPGRVPARTPAGLRYPSAECRRCPL
jgi:hypothetical protein